MSRYLAIKLGGSSWSSRDQTRLELKYLRKRFKLGSLMILNKQNRYSIHTKDQDFIRKRSKIKRCIYLPKNINNSSYRHLKENKPKDKVIQLIKLTRRWFLLLMKIYSSLVELCLQNIQKLKRTMMTPQSIKNKSRCISNNLIN